jgi:hypothetical protein
VSEEKRKMRGVGVLVEVTMQFLVEPTDAEKNGMIESAMKLTKNPASVIVEKTKKYPKALLAIFRMKNEAEYKAVEQIAHIFKRFNPLYSDITISFEQEKAYDLRMKNRAPTPAVR